MTGFTFVMMPNPAGDTPRAQCLERNGLAGERAFSSSRISGASFDGGIRGSGQPLRASHASRETIDRVSTKHSMELSLVYATAWMRYCARHSVSSGRLA